MDDSLDPDFLSSHSIAIAGLGLIGGSLALALRGRCAHLFGVDPHPPTLELAMQLGVVDEASSDPSLILAKADTLILAAPVRSILALLSELPNLHPGPAVVLDVGSTKIQIVEAMERLPDRFDPLGGHPMCGKEALSLANAEASLFEGYPFALTPLKRTTAYALGIGQAIVHAVGANPVWLDPDTHDRWVAATSHIPFILSSVLADTTPAEAAPLVGPGFRSASRLAVTPTSIMADILLTNRENILSGLASFRQGLEALERMLADSDEISLFERLERGADRRRALILEKGQDSCQTQNRGH